MLPEKYNGIIEEKRDDEQKQLLLILKEKAKPFMRKCDGYACKMDEDKQIEYTDWEGNERTLKVPSGSYVVVDADCSYPKIITAEDFEGKNEFLTEEKAKEVKTSKGPKIGIELMTGNSEY